MSLYVTTVRRPRHYRRRHHRLVRLRSRRQAYLQTAWLTGLIVAALLISAADRSGSLPAVLYRP